MEPFLFLIIATVIITLVWVVLARMLGKTGNQRAGFEPTLEEDRAATARYVQYLHHRGLLDQESQAELMDIIARDARGQWLPIVTEPTEGAAKDRETAEGITREPVRTPSAPTEPPVTAHPPRGAAEIKALIDHAHPRPEPQPEPERKLEPAREPRRPFSQVLVSFMAEKNIRWGELVGGLLILCCSTALVISLWSQIEAIPVLKFVIFTSVTAALFGVGLFVHHRWRLPTTGHAVLIVSSLLVPLNLLAFAALSRKGPDVSGWNLGLELASMALFGWLLLLAGRILVSSGPWSFACGILGLSAFSLVLRHAHPLAEAGRTLFAFAPLALYAAVMGLTIRREGRTRPLAEGEIRRLFLQLGVQTFACVVPLGLLFFESGPAGRVLHLFAPVICALAAPAFITGLFVSSRMGSSLPPQTKTAALSVSLIAAAVMLLGLGLAWPMPSRMLPALLVNVATMGALARLTRHPAIHACAASLLAAAWVLSVHLVAGGVTWSNDRPRQMLACLLSARSGQALGAPVAVCLLVAEWLRRRQSNVLARGYAITGVVLAGISVLAVTWFGFAVPGDIHHVVWVFILHSAFAFLLAWRARAMIAGVAGCLLAQMAIVQAVVYIWQLSAFQWPTSFLIGATACVGVTVLLRSLRVGPIVAEIYLKPLATFAVFFPLVAVGWMLFAISPESIGTFAGRMLWLAGLWAALSVANLQPPVFAGAQIAFIVAACAATHHRFAGSSWYPASVSALSEPWVWQAHLLVVAAIALVFALFRYAIIRGPASSVRGKARQAAATMISPPFLPTDRWVSALVILATFILSLWAVWPPVVAEHGGRLAVGVLAAHAHATGAGSFVALAILTVILLIHLWEGRHAWAVSGLLLAVISATALGAARCEPRQAVVGAWRWLLAGVFLGTSALLWSQRFWLGAVQRLGLLRPAREPLTAQVVSRWLGTLFALPAVVLTLTFALAAAQSCAPAAANWPDIWLRISLLVPCVLVGITLLGYGLTQRQPSYAVGAGSLVCVIVAVTEVAVTSRGGRVIDPAMVIRLVQLIAILSAAFALVWWVLQGFSTQAPIEHRYPRWPLILPRIALAVILVVLVGRMWLAPGRVPASAVAIGGAGGFAAVALIEFALALACRPALRGQVGLRESIWVFFGATLLAFALAPFDAGQWICFHAIMLGFVLGSGVRLYAGDFQVRRLLGAGWQETFDTASAQAGGATAAIGHDLSCVTCGYNLRSLAPTGKCPECGAAIAASLEVAVQRLAPDYTATLSRLRSHITAAVLAFVVTSTAFALRGVFSDPQRPWWSAAVLVAGSALCMAIAAWTPRRPLAYMGGLQFCLAASIGWITLYWQSPSRFIPADLTNLANVDVIALALAGMAWLIIERQLLSRRGGIVQAARWPAFHQASAVATVVAVLAMAILGGIDAALNQTITGVTGGILLAWLASLALWTACRRDAVGRHLPPALYALGLAGLLQIASHSGLAPRGFAAAISIALAGYLLLVCVVRRLWTAFVPLSDTLKPDAAWLVGANALLAGVSIASAIFVSATDIEFARRAAVVLAPILLAAAAFLSAVGLPRAIGQTAAGAMLALTAVLFSWAWVSPAMPAALLHRAVGLFAAVVLSAAISGAATRWINAASPWTIALRRTLGGAAGVGAVALLYCGAMEVLALAQQNVLTLVTSAVGVMMGAFAVSIIACVMFATSNRFDPLRLSGTAKESYVWLAEILAAMFALHVRATMPWLFSGVITQYWPILVMALAFAAVAAGEACERYGQRVLGRPLGRTGVFLPALAGLELFISASVVHYSVVLLSVGAFYAVLAALRRSITLAMLAGLSLNGSLWYLLYHTRGLGLTQHPQLWLIPPALAVLVAGQLTRDRLQPAQLRALHYGCLLAIYLSSTADIFLIGVAAAPWLPLVLAGLSVAGIFVGFASRIRSFLTLGTGFLCLSLLTMIWHAASNLGWTWVWYVAGIALGLAILAVFALFERKRSQMYAWVDQFKSWAE